MGFTVGLKTKLPVIDIYRRKVGISSFGVNHKNDFESATNVCENILSGSKYNLLGTSKAMASKSSHSNLKKL